MIQMFCIALAVIEIIVICTTVIPSFSFLQTPITLLFRLEPGSVGQVANNIKCTPVFILGCTLVSLGAVIRLAAYQALGHMFTFEMSIKKDHRLVTSGPYAYVRHPGYTGVLSFVVGATCSLGSEVRVTLMGVGRGCLTIFRDPGFANQAR